jgi:hypothetical protein
MGDAYRCEIFLPTATIMITVINRSKNTTVLSICQEGWMEQVRRGGGENT